MPDDVEDLIDREVQGGEVSGVLGLHRHRGSILLGVGLRASSSCWFEGSRDPHVKWRLWSAFCLA